jgi:hypothetical protein
MAILSSRLLPSFSDSHPLKVWRRWLRGTFPTAPQGRKKKGHIGSNVNPNTEQARDISRVAVRICPPRKVPRSIHESARDVARTEAYVTSRREREKIEMLFAHLKRILRLDRLRLRGPFGARAEFLLAATAQNLRKLAKLIPLLTLQPA